MIVAAAGTFVTQNWLARKWRAGWLLKKWRKVKAGRPSAAQDLGACAVAGAVGFPVLRSLWQAKPGPYLEGDACATDSPTMISIPSCIAQPKRAQACKGLSQKWTLLSDEYSPKALITTPIHPCSRLEC
ncbi:hypothetical protein CYMTET_26134 [Cymbomonas tetramitiformis]|uniref:Uncharacterized protein n=1 Tax=Cymbomonas tetramitiformis TaxID=36881 RepID=A0AAE0KY74_9CHLO|nr:hypothetical protein CYMTET_26134 [Cymbomonas tetramitiformis]